MRNVSVEDFDQFLIVLYTPIWPEGRGLLGAQPAVLYFQGCIIILILLCLSVHFFFMLNSARNGSQQHWGSLYNITRFQDSPLTMTKHNIQVAVKKINSLFKTSPLNKYTERLNCSLGLILKPNNRSTKR